MTPPTDEARRQIERIQRDGLERAERLHAEGHFDIGTDEARAPEQTVEPRTPTGRVFWRALTTDSQPGRVRRRPIAEWIATIEREAAAVAAPPLDVERLVQILAALEGFPGQPSVKNRTHAEYIREWYARLSQPSPDEPTR